MIKTRTALEIIAFTTATGAGKAEGTKEQKQLLGGKGASLNEMSRIGLPVPPGFTLTTEACEYFTTHDHTWPDGLHEQVRNGIRRLEDILGKTFGDSEDPLLISVRSGAAKSMPGMMDTVLNLGLNDEAVDGLAQG